MDLDGFTVVKKGGRRKTFKRTTVIASPEDQQGDLDLDKEALKVTEAVEELRKSKLFANLSAHLTKLASSCEELWCFGLGHIAGCVFLFAKKHTQKYFRLCLRKVSTRLAVAHQVGTLLQLYSRTFRTKDMIQMFINI